MANDFLSGLGNLGGGLGGGLGGLMKGLTNLMPQDDPNVKLMTTQSDVSDLAKQEEEIYGQIGRKAVELDGLDRFGELANKLRLVQSNLADARGKLEQAQQAQAAQQQAEEAQTAKCTCPSCGVQNPDGVKFCQECGTKLGADKVFCTNCGEENAPGTRFCGSCGTNLSGS